MVVVVWEKGEARRMTRHKEGMNCELLDSVRREDQIIIILPSSQPVLQSILWRRYESQ